MPPAIAAVAAGIAAGVAASSVIVGVAVGIGMAALQSSLKPDMPGVDESSREAQTLTTEPLQPRRGIYGKTVVSGSIVGYGKRKMGEKEAHVVVITLAGHNIESAELYEVNGKPKPSGTTYQIFKGDQTTVSQTALQYCDGWTNEHIGFGVSYAVVTIPIDPEEMPSGLQNVTFKVKGKRIYDPRKDTTVGGDGPHRANDEATWEWSDNSILCALDYQRFHGYKQLGLNKFDLAHIMDQANICDEMVSYNDSNNQQKSEKRFTCNGSWTFDQSPSRVLERIMSSCGGKPYRRGGKMYLQTASYHGMAEITLTDTDAADEITITPHRELKDRCNLVRASFQDPKKGYQPTDAPVVTNSIYVDRDGMELEDDLQLNFTNSSTMAQRLMKYHLERNRAGMRLEFPCKSKGLLALAGTTVRVDLPNEGIDKEFIVQDWQFDFKTKKTKLVLEEESPELYSDSLVPSEGDVTPNTELPDFTRPDAPESVSFEVDSVSTHRQGYVTWSHPTPRAVTEYRVLVRKDGDDIVEYPVIARSGVQLKQDINGLDAGQYSIEVYARNRYERTSVPATISLTLNEPSPPTSLGATAGNWEITLAPTLAGIGLGTMFEFAYGTPDKIIGRGASIVIPGLTPDTEHNVYARTVNILGRSAMRHETITTTKDTSQVDPIIETYTNRLDSVDSNFQSFVDNEFANLQQLVNDNAQEISVRFSNELFERERNDAAVLSSIIDAAASRDELRRRIERGEQLIGAVLDVDPVTGTITNRAFEYTDNRFSEAQLRLDGVAGEINATVERLTFNEERVTQLGAEIKLLPGVIDQRATAIVADSIAALEPAHAFNFFDSAQGWTAVTGTITPGVNRVLLETGDIVNSDLAYNGQEYSVIRMSVRRTAGENWLGNVEVTFLDDSTESYAGIIEPVEVLDTDVIRIVDFTALSSYHSDIKSVRVTLGQDNTDTFELKSLSVGKPDAALQDLTNIQAQVVTASSRIDALSGQVEDKVDVETWTQEGVTRTNVESVLDGIDAYAKMKVTYEEINDDGLIEKANDAALFIDGYEGTFTSYVTSLNQRLNEDGEAISQQFTTVENQLDAQEGRIRSQALSTSSNREGLESNILEDLQSAVDYGLYRFDQLDKDIRFSLAIEELQAITGPEGSLAKSIQSLQAVTQQDGEAIEAQAQRLALAETTIDGYARALQIMSARVGSQEEFAEAQLQLNASYNETLEAYEAYAFLGVEQVQDGRAVLTGVTFGGSENAISFRGDVFQWEDTQGNMLLHYDTEEGVAYLRARLVLDDGFSVTREEDIRGLDGEQGPPGPQGPEGPAGPQGVPGEPGADGQVYYTWIRYADDINGNGISNQPDGKFYMGLAYNKTSPTESNDPSDYTWSRFRGEDGTDGVQGPPGEDGQTTYTWIAYSDNADGSGMYQVPNSNTKYIGIATNKTTASESSNPSDYTWSRFRGEDGTDGVQGPPGEDGQTTYTWIAYSDNADGSGMYQVPNSNTKYIGIATNKTTASESSNPSDYTWSRFRGEDGATNIFFTGFDESDVEVSVANSNTTATRSDYNPFSGTHSYVLTTTESAPSSTGSGNVAYITIPRNIAMQFAGQNIEVALYAKKISGTSSRGFALAYSVGAADSGFKTFTPQWSWTKHTFDYYVPEDAGSSEHYIVINPDTAALGRSLQIDNVTVGRIAVDGEAGEAGTPGAGMYGQSYDTITWSTTTANNRFNALVGRNPVPLDIFVQTLSTGEDSQARQWNGSSWIQPTLMINGSLIATGTVAGDVFIAGTELNSPVIKSGRIELVGSNYMSIQTATPFGPNNLLEWKGPRNGYTYDETNKLVKFDGLTKANALQYFSEDGDYYFGGSITAGTLKNAVQSTQLGNTDVTVGPFGSNGGLIEIKCSINAARSTGLVSGNCPYPTPSAPTGTMRLYRQTSGGEVLVATQNVSGSYNCFDEGSEHIENWQLSGSFTYTDNLQTASNRTYRLEVTHNLPIYPNGSQSLSLITEEA